MASRKVKYWAHDVHAYANNIESGTKGLMHLGVAVEAGLCWPGQAPGRYTEKQANEAIRSLTGEIQFLRACIDGLEKAIKNLNQALSPSKPQANKLTH